MDNSELTHWGVKGMKWGIRRYQNKDGSLTPAGQKRYNKELTKLEAEKAKLDRKEYVLNNRAKTKAMVGELDKLRSENAARKKALKEAEKDLKSGKQKKPEEDLETQKAKVLASRSASEVYKNAHLFTDQELQAAYQRLNTERNIKNLAPVEVSKGERMANNFISKTKKAHDVYDNGSKIYNDIAKLYNTFSPNGRKKPWPIIKNDDDNKNKDKNNDSKSKKIKDAILNKDKDKKKDKTNDNNKPNNDTTDTNNSKSSDNNTKTNTNTNTNTNANTSSNNTNSDTNKVYEGDVVGRGTSTYNPNRDRNSTIIDVDANTSTSDIPNSYVSIGQNYIDGYLEDRK